MPLLVFFLPSTLGTGLLATRSIPAPLYAAERYALTVFLGIFLSTWTLLIGSWIFGFTAGTYITIILGIAAGVTSHFIKRPADISWETTRQRTLWLAVTGTFSLITAYLLYTHMLGPGPDGAYSASGSWGDLPMHLSIISHFARIPDFSWDFSLMANARLTYPFLIDFLSGMIMRWSGSLRLALLLSSLPLCLALVQILFFGFTRVLASVRAGAIATCLFFLSGSSFGFGLMVLEFLHQRPFHFSFLWHLPVDYSNTNIYGYGNFFNSILLPQRSFQFGLSAFCVVALLLYHIFQTKQAVRFSTLLITSTLIGLLPLAHTHTFFVAAGLFVLSLLFLVWQKRLGARDAVLALLPLLIIGLPQLRFQLTANGHLSFLKFHPAWMFGSGALAGIRFRPLAMAVYILANFGLLFGLSVLGYRSIRTNGPLRAVFWFGWAIFLAGNIVVFQPAEYDNIKFFIYGSLFLIPPIALLIARLSQKQVTRASAIFLLFVASGCTAVIFELPQKRLLYTTQDFEQAAALRDAVPPTAIVLTSDAHQHPFWSLAGQQVLRGYSYWLWSYGLPVQRLDAAVPAIYAGGDTATSLIDRYKVEYVYIGPTERTMYAVNEPFFAERYPVVFDRFDSRVYKVR